MDQQLSALLDVQQVAVTFSAGAPTAATGTPQSFANTLKEELGELAELDVATQALLSEAGTLLLTPVPLVAVVEGQLALTWPVGTATADGNSSPQSGNDLPWLLQSMDSTRVLPQAFTGASVTQDELAAKMNVLDPERSLLDAAAQTGMLAALPAADSIAGAINPAAASAAAAGFAAGVGLAPSALIIPTALAMRGEEALAVPAQTASRDQPGQHPPTPQELELLTSVAALLVPLKERMAEGGESALPVALNSSPFEVTANTSGAPLISGMLVSSNITATSVTPGRAELAIPQAPGQPGWGDVFAEHVTFVVKQNLQEAEIRLNPPYLGQVEMRIVMNNDQASLVFSSPHGAVREAIEASLGRLRDMLADSGFTLVNVDVSDKSLAQQRGDAREQSESGRGGSQAGYRADFELAAHAPQALSRIGSIDYYV